MRIKKVILVFIIIIVSFLFCFPLLKSLNKIVFEDAWLEFYAYHDISITSFIKEFRIPFWIYHFNGGYPIIKHPHYLALSPLFFFLLVPFGAAAGLKLFVFFFYVIGALGFFALARKLLKCNLIASLLITSFYIFNSFIPYRVNTGSVTIPIWLCVPLIIYTLFFSKENRHYIFYCACLIAFTILNGFGLYFPPMVLFLFVFVVFDCLSRPQKRLVNSKSILPGFLLILTITFFLAAVKICPILDLLKDNPREMGAYIPDVNGEGGMSFKKMILAFFSRGPYADGNEALMGENGLGIGMVAYYGIIPGILFFLSGVFCFGKNWKYLLIVIFFICICMSHRCFVDLFHIFWRLPLFHSIGSPPRYFIFPVIFLVPIVIGNFFSSNFFARLNKRIKITIYLLAMIGAIDMFAANIQYFKFTANAQEDVSPRQMNNIFFNVKTIDLDSFKNYLPYTFEKVWSENESSNLEYGFHYYLSRQNIGLIDWFNEIYLRSNVIPKYNIVFGYGDYWKNFRNNISEDNGIIENKNYRGESFFLNNKENKVSKIQWNTNEIIIDIYQVKPDKLVVNQNYDASWKSNYGEIVDVNGLLGVELAKPREGQIVLFYRPWSFYLGLLVSSICFLISGGYFFLCRRYRN